MTIPLSSHPPLGIALEAAKLGGLQRPEDTNWEYIYPFPMMRRARAWRLLCHRHRLPVDAYFDRGPTPPPDEVLLHEVILKAHDWASPFDRKRIFVGQCPECLTIYWTEFRIV